MLLLTQSESRQESISGIPKPFLDLVFLPFECQMDQMACAALVSSMAYLQPASLVEQAWQRLGTQSSFTKLVP